MTILENSLEMRHAAKHQSRPLKDDRNVSTKRLAIGVLTLPEDEQGNTSILDDDGNEEYRKSFTD